MAVRAIAAERPRAAESFRSGVEATVTRLKRLPLSGVVVEANRIPNLREVYCHPYRIIYRVYESKKVIHVVNLWHAARDEPTRADLLG
jgi:plasmid stabilization system protein ParE